MEYGFDLLDTAENQREVTKRFSRGVGVKKLDDFIAACSCGWMKAGMQHDIYATRAARQHVNRSRKPGHLSVALNVSQLMVVGTYVKGQARQGQTDLLDQPPF